MKKSYIFLLNNAIAAAIMQSVSVAGARHGHVSPLDSTRLFPDADFRVDIDPAIHSSDAPNNGLVDGRAYGSASIFPTFIRKMQQATGNVVNLPEGYSYHAAQVQTLYLTKSSVRHTDYRLEGAPVNPSDPNGSLTAFYVQESTADAYFDIDDDEMCIPFVEGNVIYFNGGLPHNSVVKSGAVKLVGPFLLQGLQSVGQGKSPATPAPATPAPTKSPATPAPTKNSKSSKTRAPKASKAPANLSTLQVQKMTSGGSSVTQTSLAGVSFWLVSLMSLSLGAFFSF